MHHPSMAPTGFTPTPVAMQQQVAAPTPVQTQNTMGGAGGAEGNRPVSSSPVAGKYFDVKAVFKINCRNSMVYCLDW